MTGYDFSNKDLYAQIYIPLLHDKNRYNVIYGGRNSAKSHFIAQDIIMNLLNDEFFRFILLRKYRASIKDSQWQTIVDLIRLYELQEEFHITTSPLEIVCLRNHNKVLSRGLDKDSNTKSIKDATGCWYEEADEITESAFLESTITIRTPRRRYLKEYFTFNPSFEKHWINNFFFPEKQTYEKEDGNFHYVKSIEPNTTILHTTYKDNPFCQPRDALFLESLKDKDENHYKVKALGLWGGALKGLIYDQWSFCDDIPYGADVAFGLDGGFKNPTALVLVAYQEERLFVKELLYLTERTPDDIAKIIEADYKDVIGKNIIICDAANPDLIEAVRRKGFNVHPAIKGPGSVYNGIMKVKSFDLNITRDSTNLSRELQSYVWKPSSGLVISDEPVKIDDHALDAMRYVVQTYGVKFWKKNETKKESQIINFSRPTRVKERFF